MKADPEYLAAVNLALEAKDAENADLRAALKAVLRRDGGKSCRCIYHSRDAEREYELGVCPHQKAAELLSQRQAFVITS
jgi:hypothetical protein